MKLKLGPRDKVLLAILGVVLVGAAFYFLIFDPITTHIDQQRIRESELEVDLIEARADQATLAIAREQQVVVLAQINEIIGSYYPYVPPQYFAYLLQYFATELDLSIFLMQVESPSFQELTGIIEDDFEPRDGLLESIAAFNELARAREEAGETEQGEEQPADVVIDEGDVDIEPGMVILNRLQVEVKDGNVGQYLSFLRSINEAAHPIYVSEYALTLNQDQELEMRVSISVIAFDRLSVEQWQEDRSRFTFEPQQPRGVIDIFAVSGFIRGVIGNIGIDVDDVEIQEEPEVEEVPENGEDTEEDAGEDA